jgi:hypothetical protein
MNSQSVDHTAAYFALAGALGAAIVAIIGNQFGAWRQRKADQQRLDKQLDTEQTRLERQLEAEQERLERTLAADAKRQSEALAHDRYLRKQESIREQIGPMIQRSIDTNAPARALAVSAREAYENPEDQELWTELVKRRAAIAIAASDISTDSIRLALVVGDPRAEVVTNYRAVARVLREMRDATPVERTLLSAEHVERLSALDDEHTAMASSFQLEASDIATAWDPPMSLPMIRSRDPKVRARLSDVTGRVPPPGGFSYTLNGGSRATVAVTVTGAPRPRLTIGHRAAHTTRTATSIRLTCKVTRCMEPSASKRRPASSSPRTTTPSRGRSRLLTLASR